MKVQFGNKVFEIKDVWPSTVDRPYQAIENGLCKGSSFLSFPLTEEQKKFLGETSATYFRVEVKTESAV